MADPATQSPYISSSAGGGPSEPGAAPIPAGGRDCKGSSSQSCADSFVSSSQPVSLFTTSQEGTSLLSDKTASGILTSENQPPGLTAWADSSREIDSKPPPSKKVKELVVAVDNKRMDSFRGPSADSGIEATSIGSPGSEGSPFSVGAEPHSYSPVISTSSPEQTHVRGTSISLSEDGKAEQSRCKDQDFMDQNKRTTIGSDSRFTFLTDQKQDTEPPLIKKVCLHSSTPSGGETSMEKDSPESPFEVIIDKAAFDKEYKDSLISNSSDLSSNWVMHSERELLTDIPEDSVCEFQVKTRSGSSIPAGPGLSRQSSGTTAALEEVSKCVREMHSFTNELLNWDLIPKVEHADKVAETSGSDLPEMPSKNAGGTPTQPAGYRTEACKALSPHPVTVSIQQKDRTYTELAAHHFEKHVPLDQEAVKLKNASSAAVELKADRSWPSSGLAEITDADSSGESDDTVIEDVPIDLAFENEKLVLHSTGSGMAPVEKLTLAPVAAGKTRDWIIADNEEASNKLHKHSREIHLPSKTPEDNQGFIDDFETIHAHPDIVGGSPVAEAKHPRSSTLDLTSINMQQSGGCDSGFFVKPLKAGEIPSISPMEIPLKDLRNVPNERVPLSLPLGNLKEQERPDALSGENLVDFMRECLKSKGGDSLEDLTETTSEAETAALKTTPPGMAVHKDEANKSEVKGDGDYAVRSITDDKGNLQKPLFSQRSPTVAQDFEQEQLTIKALKELGGKLDEKQTPTQSKTSSPAGGRLAQDHDTSTPAQKSALEKRPLCIQQQTDMKPAPAHISTDGEIPREAVWDSVAESPVEHALVRLLTGFSVHDLIFWRDVKKTGFVFGTSLIMLLSLAAFSVISVVSYLILALLSVTISFRVYKSVIQAIQKSEEGHPFKAYLDLEITLSSEAFHNYVNAAMVHVNRALKLIIRLFLVEDLVDSLKLAVVMWLMTYVGAVFNGITLLILGELLIFGVPVVYEKYKTQIDHYVGIARDQTKSIIAKIQAKLPGVVKKKSE
ncbi:reticulon-3 isoform X3 [Emydura macquarii macquarii]|uniref:reticulon-3 isoform X3 n=1 Tax=Emydura macquarii macquarii TaxID=1129001 RepID=UPI00352A7C2F